MKTKILNLLKLFYQLRSIKGLLLNFFAFFKFTKNMSQQHQNDMSIIQVDNQSARLNQQGNQVTVFQRIRNNNWIKLSRKNIFKGVFLIIIILGTFWIGSDFLHESLIRQRTPFKFGSETQNTYQIAAPSDTPLKSFYYFKKIVQMAKENVKKGQTFQKGFQNFDSQFDKIQFWELYGIFKVVKAIQLANKYEQDIDSQQDGKNEDDKQQDKYESVDNLTAPVNLTKYFSPVADQVKCASCYSFPIAATIEYQITKKTGKIIKLSQQQLIDCSNPDVNANGCNDGNMTRGFEYARDKGLVQQALYPYRSQNGQSYQCNQKIISPQANEKHKIKNFRSLPAGKCQAIQFELVSGNAVASMINVGKMNDIKNYSEPFRDCLRTAPNHAVTIVGQTENQDWIVRNSWGQNWGNNGYFIIKKGNTCGICNHAIVPEIQ